MLGRRASVRDIRFGGVVPDELPRGETAFHQVHGRWNDSICRCECYSGGVGPTLADREACDWKSSLHVWWLHSARGGRHSSSKHPQAHPRPLLALALRRYKVRRLQGIGQFLIPYRYS